MALEFVYFGGRGLRVGGEKLHHDDALELRVVELLELLALDEGVTAALGQTLHQLLLAVREVSLSLAD